jgi:hypothetical protein
VLNCTKITIKDPFKPAGEEKWREMFKIFKVADKKILEFFF